MLDWFNKLLGRDMFMGHDLNKWLYLGYAEIAFEYRETKGIDYGKVYYFYRKDNSKTRSFYVWPRWFKRHQYVQGTMVEWKKGFRNLSNGLTRPLPDLQKIVLEQHNKVWDDATEWWKPVDKKD
jgi:hypothetical protein